MALIKTIIVTLPEYLLSGGNINFIADKYFVVSGTPLRNAKNPVYLYNEHVLKATYSRDFGGLPIYEIETNKGTFEVIGSRIQCALKYELVFNPSL